MKKKKIDLSVIILNFNTRDLLKDCLKSVRNSKLGRYTLETIVVDNASSDESVAMVKKEFPGAKIVVNKKNIGFAAGNNNGIPWAEGRYLLFLNPDTEVLAETFKTMIKFMDKHPRVGASTCRVELPNGRLDYPCHRGFPTPWNALTFFSGLARIFPKVKLFNGYTLSYLSLNKVHEIDSISGSFFFIRREAGEELNWWDEDYFWYGEDLDLCYRLKEKDWQIMFVPQTKIIHYRGAASGIIKHSQKMSLATKQTKIRSAQASTEAMRIFYRKHYQEKYPRFIFWLVLKGIKLLEKIRLSKFS